MARGFGGASASRLFTRPHPAASAARFGLRVAGKQAGTNPQTRDVECWGRRERQAGGFQVLCHPQPARLLSASQTR